MRTGAIAPAVWDNVAPTPMSPLFVRQRDVQGNVSTWRSNDTACYRW
jgi:hypothetical protein